MANEVCFRNRHRDRSWALDVYEGDGGYQAWRRILSEKTPPDEIITEVKSLKWWIKASMSAFISAREGP